MKKCTFCKEIKDLSQFHKNKSKKDGHNNVCKTCRKEYHKKWYEQGKRDYVVNRNAKHRLRNKTWLYNYLLEHPCVDCGEDDPVVLEFDHLKDKIDNVGKMAADGVSLKKLREEIAKCQVVCANCHKRRTAMRQGWYKLPQSIKVMQ